LTQSMKPIHCSLNLITQEGCPACSYLKDNFILTDDEVEILHIATEDDFDTIFSRYPDVKHVPALIIDCGSEGLDMITGLNEIEKVMRDWKDMSGFADEDYEELEDF